MKFKKKQTAGNNEFLANVKLACNEKIYKRCVAIVNEAADELSGVIAVKAYLLGFGIDWDSDTLADIKRG